MSKRATDGSVPAVQDARRRPAAVPASPQPRQEAAQATHWSRVGKVQICAYLDPLVRKQLGQISLDTDLKQVELIAEAFNLLFERYGKPPIARHR